MKKATKSLPKSSPKKVKVLARVMQSLSPNKRRMIIGACGKSTVATARKIRSDALTEEQIVEVEKFYETDGISRMSPGRKDYSMSV